MSCAYCGGASERSICDRCSRILRRIERPVGGCRLEVVAPETSVKSKPIEVDPSFVRSLEQQQQQFLAALVRGLAGIAAHEAILDCLHRLENRQWNMARFENVMTWGSRSQALDVVGFFDQPPPFSICGTTATQLAMLLLGTERGERLSNQLNTFISTSGDVQHVARDDTIEGHGVEALQRAFTRWTHAIAIVQGGPTHRFVIERRPDGKVVLLHSWVDNFAFTHWMGSGVIVRPLDEFLELLRRTISQRDDERVTANVELFHPGGFKYLAQLRAGAQISFSACEVQPRSVLPNVEYFFKNSTFDGAKFAP